MQRNVQIAHSAQIDALGERAYAGYGEHVSRRRVLLGVAIAAVAVAAALVHRLVTPVPS